MWTIPSIVYCASFYYRQVVESTFHFLQSIGPHYNGPAPWQEGVHTLLYLLLDDKEMMTFSIMLRFFDFMKFTIKYCVMYIYNTEKFYIDTMMN